MSIGNVSAYDAAIARRIAASRAQTAAAKRNQWLLEDPSRAELIRYLDGRQMRSEFARKLLDSFQQWGTLTENQEAAVRRMQAQDAERDAARIEQNAARAAVSKHVSDPGVRSIFGGVKVEWIRSFDSNFGTCHIHGMVDADGNVLIYKGSAKIGAPGETLLFKATVKEHGSRDGVKQTVLSRPQVIGRHPAPETAA
jgi:uncharacterized protein with PIN domain